MPGKIGRPLMILALLLLAGCPPVAEVTPLGLWGDAEEAWREGNATGGALSIAEPSAERGLSQRSPRRPLEERLAETLERERTERRMMVSRHAAWQVLHAIVAYGEACLLETADGRVVGAVDYLLSGGTLNGWELLPGDRLGDPPRRGIRVELDPGSKVGPGHRDQWLAYLTTCDLPLSTPIQVAGESRELRDLLAQALWDVPRNFEQEYSWTLIGLTAYYPTTHRWVARDGRNWSVERLLQAELQHDLQESACGGTHRLAGIARAVQRHRAAGQPISGVWRDAERVVERAIAQSQQFQNADGSFSSAFMHRPGWSGDLADQLQSTGHTLEFLAIAASDEVLAEPWVERAAERLLDLLDAAVDTELECGSLYHALGGLAIYQQRRFGTAVAQ